jgi:putative Mg2+ transporter-C (MgtC) family protein
MLLGAMVGLDRQLARKPVGLCTHMMASAAASLLVGLGVMIVQHFKAESGYTRGRSDPLRIIEAVITGVSFLGAGTMVRQGSAHEGQGLTAAASLLLAVSVGVTVALSQVV